MDTENVELRVDEEDQHARSTRKVKMNEDGNVTTTIFRNDDERPDSDASSLLGEKHLSPAHRENTGINAISYRNKLMGVNRGENAYSSDDSELWEEEDDSDDNMQEDVEKEVDLLCLDIPITIEERKKLCSPRKKAIIIKLLGKKIGYRFLNGRLAKLWNLNGEFELIDLQNEFFKVRFYEVSDYGRVLYNGPWMILVTI